MNRSAFKMLLLVVLSLLAAATAGRDPQPVCAQSPSTKALVQDKPRAAARRSAEEFFEARIRPIFAQHCIMCHGPRKQRGGLRLDSVDGLRKGSDNGEIVVAGDPDQSILIDVIRYEGSTKMPPRGKLPQPAIDALTQWVTLGAIWPNAAGPQQPGAADSTASASDHWAFQPVRKPTVPKVNDASWCATPIDAFILARLEAKGLTPSAQADRATLIRRATFDLHGLPPTPEEVAAFEADASPYAFATLVDRLLASPRYGERWGRHWLDVARYADTKGYVRLNENPRYVCAWTYRDWVVCALNEDLPYDQFILQQLAADQLELGDDPRPLAALGFLTLGQRFINSKHDIIDDRIDVTMRGLQGLTVSCARCHDHKYDPIPTRDYYSLHGVFVSSSEPPVPALVLPASQRAAYAPFLHELEQRTDQFDAFLRAQQSKLTSSFRARAGEYLLAAQREQLQANFLAVMFLVDAAKDLNPVMVQRWGRLLDQTRRGHHAVLEPWHKLAAIPPDEFSTQAAGLVTKWSTAGDADVRFNPLVVAALQAAQLHSLADAARCYGELMHEADRRWQQLRHENPAATQLDDSAWEEIRRLLYGPGAPPDVALGEVEEFMFVDTTVEKQFHEQQRRVEDWLASPDAAPCAHILVDAPTPYDPRVFVRGNPSNPGEAVPRQFLEVLSRGERRPFQHGSGRLELAQAIADPANPLTARVMVNRLWMHHFGMGLVRTPGDFGTRGEPPTHPELLDYLAARLVEEGWSLKALHRLIMLSSVYQQRSDDRPDARQLDPENTLWWKMNRQRLDWEAMRDAMLAVSGSLDATMGGPPVDLTAQPASGRRTLYALVDRQNLPSVWRTFDFTPPDATSAQRHETTVPQQALFLMNSPFLKEQVRRLAARTQPAGDGQLAQHIDALHRLLYARRSEPEEIVLAQQFLQAGGAAGQDAGSDATRLTPWEEYVQVLLMANEFSFID